MKNKHDNLFFLTPHKSTRIWVVPFKIKFLHSLTSALNFFNFTLKGKEKGREKKKKKNLKCKTRFWNIVRKGLGKEKLFQSPRLSLVWHRNWGAGILYREVMEGYFYLRGAGDERIEHCTSYFSSDSFESTTSGGSKAYTRACSRALSSQAWFNSQRLVNFSQERSCSSFLASEDSSRPYL